jgi:hypothetical protein
MWVRIPVSAFWVLIGVPAVVVASVVFGINEPLSGPPKNSN